MIIYGTYTCTRTDAPMTRFIRNPISKTKKCSNVRSYSRIHMYSYTYIFKRRAVSKGNHFFLYDNVNAQQIFYENVFHTVFKSGRSRLKKIKIYIARHRNSFKRGQNYVYASHKDTNNNCGYTYQVHIYIRKREVVELDCVTIDYVLLYFTNRVTNWKINNWKSNNTILFRCRCLLYSHRFHFSFYPSVIPHNVHRVTLHLIRYERFSFR